MSRTAPITVVETPEFLSATVKAPDGRGKVGADRLSGPHPMPATWFRGRAVYANCGGDWKGVESVVVRA
jgi:hypothetical protein